jgi:predicted dehydrogenase
MRTAPEPPIGVAVVGYGYWGPNIVRNVVERPEMRLRVLCELDAQRGRAFEHRHPGIPVAGDFDAVLDDPTVDAVAIATPPRTHYTLASRALAAGKHVLVEKPLATTAADATELVCTAAERGLVLMPGHTFLYSPPVNKVRDLIRGGELGEDIYFVTSSRMNLGVYQPDGVVCDLAPHDLSILLYWLDRPVEAVAATACCVFQDDVPETAFLTVRFAGKTTANLQISWLAPRKVRQMVVVGSRRMVQYEDTAAEDTVRVYDRGLDFSPPASFGEYRLTYRSGDMVAPRLDAHEPLSLELEDFTRAIREGLQPRSSAALGVEIVRVLEAAQKSLVSCGQPVALASGLQAGASEAAQANGNGRSRPPTDGGGDGRDATQAGAMGNGRPSNGNGHLNGNSAPRRDKEGTDASVPRTASGDPATAAYDEP